MHSVFILPVVNPLGFGQITGDARRIQFYWQIRRLIENFAIQILKTDVKFNRQQMHIY